MWNDQTQAKLETLASSKLRASEIAVVLGTTRNAVIGRAHRTGVKLLPRVQAFQIACGGTDTAFPCGHPRTAKKCPICKRAYDKARRSKDRNAAEEMAA